MDMSLIVYSQDIDGSWKANHILRDMIKRAGKKVKLNPP